MILHHRIFSKLSILKPHSHPLSFTAGTNIQLPQILFTLLSKVEHMFEVMEIGRCERLKVIGNS